LGNPQALVGTTLGNTFVLDKVIGQGAHGVLYEGHHMRLGYRCAVRLVHADAGRREALLTAMSRYAQIVHPSLVPPREALPLPDDQVVLGTPLLPGQDLNQRVAAHGKMTLAEGVALMRQLCGALHALHQRGLSHGAVTPSNVFFTRFDDVAIDSALGDGKGMQIVQLVDMGLVVLNGGAAQPSPAEDQKALGRLMLSFVSDLSPGQRKALERSQEVRPEARYASMQEMWQAFDAARGKKAQAAQSTALVQQISVRPRRTPVWIYGTIAALVVIVLSVGLQIALRAMKKDVPVKPQVVSLPAEKPQPPPEVTLQMQLTPSDAKVQIDDKPVADPQRIQVKRSSTPVKLTVSADGYKTYSMEITPDADRPVKVMLEKDEPVEDTSKKKRGKKKSKKKSKK
jgi:serine/threonine protein kinase